jgi:hypothetical protein
VEPRAADPGLAHISGRNCPSYFVRYIVLPSGKLYEGVSMSNTFFLKTWRQKIACASALMMLYLGIVVLRHAEEQEHVERISSIAVGSFVPASNVAHTATITYNSSLNVDAGLVLPESRLHNLYVSIG